MKITYFEKFDVLFSGAEKSLYKLSNFKKKPFAVFVFLFCIIQTFAPLNLSSQTLVFGYSYYNLSRNTAGGTLQQGDTIEVHALVNVKATTYKMYYIDTIPVGTQYVSNSIRLTTNEGVIICWQRALHRCE